MFPPGPMPKYPRLPMSKTMLKPQIVTTSNKKLLGTKGIATSSKDATSSSWPYYYRNKKLLGTKGIATNREQGCYTLFAQVFSGVATDVC